MLLPRRRVALRRCSGALWSVIVLGLSCNLARPAAADTGGLIPAAEYLESFHSRSRGLHSVPLTRNQHSQQESHTDVHTSTEPEAWAKHFQRRRLQQDGLALAPEAGFGFSAVQTTPPSASPPAGSDQLFTLTTQNGSDTTNQLTALNTGALSGDSLAAAMPLAPGPAAADLSACNTLAYSGGYANLSIQPYQTVRFTANMGQCCDLCDADSECVAWTRVAGGQANTRACYLMNNLGSVSSAGALPPTLAGAGPAAAPAAAPEASLQAPVQTLSLDSTALAVNDSWPHVLYTTADQPVILETGTKSSSVFPALMYGCPYPASDSGACEPPQYCNCFDGICYGSCQDDGGTGL